MGIYLTKKIDKTSFVGIWEINDTVEYLLSQLKLSKDEEDLYKRFQTSKRRLHWLSYRVMIHQLLKKKTEKICYNINGKPYLLNGSYHISVSHSGKFSAVIFSNNFVGIDIEKIKPGIEALSDKFMSKIEMQQIEKKHITEQLYIYWGAKEALYKLYGSKNLIFKNNILIQGFPYQQEGTLQGKILTSDFEKNYLLYYQQIEDYMLVYATSS